MPSHPSLPGLAAPRSRRSRVRSFFSALFIPLAFALSPVAAQQTLEVAAAPNPALPADSNLKVSERFAVHVRKPNQTWIPTLALQNKNDWDAKDYWSTSQTDHPSHEKPQDAATVARLWFDNGPIEVRVTILKGMATMPNVSIRPLRHGIQPVIDPLAKTITFTLTHHAQLSVEIDTTGYTVPSEATKSSLTGAENPLFLFANPLPDAVPQNATLINPGTHNNSIIFSDGSNRAYTFGPGFHRFQDQQIVLRSNTTLHLHRDAILEARFMLLTNERVPNSGLYHTPNVKLVGGGVLSGARWPHTRPYAKTDPDTDYAQLKETSMIRGDRATNLRIAGLTLLDNNSWNIAFSELSSSVISNVQVVAFNGNTDGFWIAGDNNRVENFFVFNNDDGIVLKKGSNNRVKNLTYWSGPWGRSVLFHNLSTSDHSRNNVIDGVDIIGKDERPILSPAPIKSPFFLSIHEKAGKNAEIENLAIKNVRIERRRPGDTFAKIDTTQPSDGDDTKFDIKNLHFENVTLDTLQANEIQVIGSSGTDGDGEVDGVTFRNLRVANVANALTTAAASNATIASAANVAFVDSERTLYLDTFANATGTGAAEKFSTAIPGIAWKQLSDTTESPHYVADTTASFTFNRVSDATGPDEIPALVSVNAGVITNDTRGFAVMQGGFRTLTYTEEFPLDRDLHNIEAMTWDSARTGGWGTDAANYSQTPALRIGGKWYVKHPAVSLNNFGTETNFATTAQADAYPLNGYSWRLLKADLGAPFEVGSTNVTLPSGDVTAFGIYAANATSTPGQDRGVFLDNFEVVATQRFTGLALFPETVSAPAIENKGPEWNWGMRFKLSTGQTGRLGGIRVWRRVPGGLDNYTFQIWRASDSAPLHTYANVAATGSSSGWVEFPLPTEVRLDPGVEYIVSYKSNHAAHTYPARPLFDLPQPVSNGIIETVGDGLSTHLAPQKPTVTLTGKHYGIDVRVIPD